MRLSDLLKMHAVTEDGESVGHVHDVRFRRSSGKPWTVDSLVVGPSSFAVRLGYSRGVVRGPALLRAVLGWLSRHGRTVPWDAVIDVGDRIVVRGAPDDFGHLTDNDTGD